MYINMLDVNNFIFLAFSLEFGKQYMYMTFNSYFKGYVR